MTENDLEEWFSGSLSIAKVIDFLIFILLFIEYDWKAVAIYFGLIVFSSADKNKIQNSLNSRYANIVVPAIMLLVAMGFHEVIRYTDYEGTAWYALLVALIGFVIAKISSYKEMVAVKLYIAFLLVQFVDDYYNTNESFEIYILALATVIMASYGVAMLVVEFDD